MFFADVPLEMPQPLIIAQLEQVKQIPEKERVIGVCRAVPNAEGHDPFESSSPATLALGYLKRYEKVLLPNTTPYKLTVVESPKHGAVKEDDGDFIYVPSANYFGKDQATILVEIGGYKVKVVYFIQAVNDIRLGGSEEPDPYCGDTPFWKISSLPTGTILTTITYSNLINDALGAFKGFTDLPIG